MVFFLFWALFSASATGQEACQAELSSNNAACSESIPCANASDSCLQVDTFGQGCSLSSSVCTSNSDCCSGLCIDDFSNPLSVVKRCEESPNFRQLYGLSNSCKIATQACNDGSDCCSGVCDTGRCTATRRCVKKTGLEEQICGVSVCGTASIKPDPFASFISVNLYPVSGTCVAPLCIGSTTEDCPPPTETGSQSSFTMTANENGDRCVGNIADSDNAMAVNAQKFTLAFEFVTSTHTVSGNYEDRFQFLRRLNALGLAHRAARVGADTAIRDLRGSFEEQLNAIKSDPTLDPEGTMSMQMQASYYDVQAEKSMILADLYLKIRRDNEGKPVLKSDGHPDYTHQGMVKQLRDIAGNIRNHNWGCRKIISTSGLFTACACGQSYSRDRNCKKHSKVVFGNELIDPLMPDLLRSLNNPTLNQVERSLTQYAQNAESKIDHREEYTGAQSNEFSVNEGQGAGRLASLKDIARTSATILFLYGQGSQLPGPTRAQSMYQVAREMEQLGLFHRQAYTLFKNRADCLRESARLRALRFGNLDGVENNTGNGTDPATPVNSVVQVGQGSSGAAQFTSGATSGIALMNIPQGSEKSKNTGDVSAAPPAKEQEKASARPAKVSQKNNPAKNSLPAEKVTSGEKIEEKKKDQNAKSSNRAEIAEKKVPSSTTPIATNSKGATTPLSVKEIIPDSDILGEATREADEKSISELIDYAQTVNQNPAKKRAGSETLFHKVTDIYHEQGMQKLFRDRFDENLKKK